LTGAVRQKAKATLRADDTIEWRAASWASSTGGGGSRWSVPGAVFAWHSLPLRMGQGAHCARWRRL